MPATTRRAFLQAAGGSAAATAAAAALGCHTPSRAARPDAPNVVIVIVDTLRADHVYEERAKTPNMDELVRAGLRFTRMYPEAMPTVPARNSILSGRRVFPFRHWHDYPGLIDSPGWSPLGDVRHSLTSALKRAGWWTACVTDNPFLGFSSPYLPFRQSLDLFSAKGGQLGTVKPPSSVSDRTLRHWVHPTLWNSPSIRLRVRKYMANGHYWKDDSQSFAARVFREATDVLDVAARRQPFALIVDTYEPHEPWTPPRRFIDLYGDPDYHDREPSMPRYLAARRWLNDRNKRPVLRRMQDLYAAEVTMTDRWLGAFLDRLYARGLERDTVIVLVSDHGILLGEHGWTGKISVALHPALTRVPLVIVDPQRRLAGTASRYFASTHDVAPTVLSMVGVRPPASMEGVDLSAFFRGTRPPEREFAYGGYANSFYYRSDRWVLIADNQPKNLKLFDLEHDRGEHENLTRRRPQLARELAERVAEQAGGRLPYYADI